MAISVSPEDYKKEKEQIEGPECSSSNEGETVKFSIIFKTLLIYLRLR